MNQGSIEKNKAALDKMKQKIASLKVAEQEKLKKEEAQIQEVKALLEKLESNKRTREMNMAAYDAKVQEIEKEKSDWDSQRQVASELTKVIDQKEAEATTEKAKWSSKKNEYHTEALKWYKQAEKSDQAQARFKRLGD